MFGATSVLATLLVLQADKVATFTPLGTLHPNSTRPILSRAFDVSDDGSVVVGADVSDPARREAFRWTESQGMQGLGDFPGGDFLSGATAVSADGRVVIGGGTARIYATSDGFRWTDVTGLQHIPPLSTNVPSYQSSATGISADGSIIVGDSRLTSGSPSVAITWTEATGSQSIGPNLTSAFGISSDGHTIVGGGNFSGQMRAYRWTEATGAQSLGVLPGTTSSYALSVSGDGSTVIGPSSGPGVNKSFIWTESDGMMEVERLNSSRSIMLTALTEDGSIGVGYESFQYSPFSDLYSAVIWDKDGSHYFQDFLADEYGLILPGWTLRSAYGISSDGRFIVGEATNPSGQLEAYRISIIPAPSSLTLLAIGASLVAAGKGLRRLWRNRSGCSRRSQTTGIAS